METSSRAPDSNRIETPAAWMTRIVKSNVLWDILNKVIEASVFYSIHLWKGKLKGGLHEKQNDRFLVLRSMMYKSILGLVRAKTIKDVYASVPNVAQILEWEWEEKIQKF